MPPYKRVVVLMKAFIGDAVMATPLLEGLRKQVETFVVAPPHIGEVLGPDWREAFIPITGSGFLPRVRAMRQPNADLAIVLNRSFRSALAARVAGIKTRVGHDAEGRGFLLTHRIRLDWECHESTSYLALAEAVGLTIEPSHPRLVVTASETRRGSELLAGADLALQPGARHEYKRLILPTLTNLISRLREAGFKPVLVGGNDEMDTAKPLLAEFPDLPCLVGQCTLRETLGVLAGVRLTVGADTGVMHLAAAVGSPTVTVFEPSQPASRWGHLYSPHQVVQAPPAGMAAVGAESIFTAIQAATSLKSRATP